MRMTIAAGLHCTRWVGVIYCRWHTDRAVAVRHGTAVWISNDGRGHGVPVTRAGDWHGSSVLVHHAPLHSAAARPPAATNLQLKDAHSYLPPRRADIDYCRRVSTFHRRRTPIHSRTDRVITQAGCMAAAGVGRAPGCVCLSTLWKENGSCYQHRSRHSYSPWQVLDVHWPWGQ